MRVLSYCLILSIIFQACTLREVSGDDVAVLMGFQEQEKKAHLQKNVSLMVEMLHDTICQIKDGKVTYLTKDEMAKRFSQYFGMVEFIKWEDSSPPLITLSPDHSLAHVLVERHVELVARDSVSRVEKTDFAWTELWKKKNGRWRLHTITTTDRPG